MAALHCNVYGGGGGLAIERLQVQRIVSTNSDSVISISK